jgi:hypothetical protein
MFAITPAQFYLFLHVAAYPPAGRGRGFNYVRLSQTFHSPAANGCTSASSFRAYPNALIKATMPPQSALKASTGPFGYSAIRRTMNSPI